MTTKTKTPATAKAARKIEVIQQMTQNKTYLPESAMRKQVERDLTKLSMSTLYGLQTIMSLRIRESQKEVA